MYWLCIEAWNPLSFNILYLSLFPASFYASFISVPAVSLFFGQQESSSINFFSLPSLQSRKIRPDSQFRQLARRPWLHFDSHTWSHSLQRKSTLHSPLLTYSPPEISIAFPLIRASATFCRAFWRPFQKVYRETSIRSAAFILLYLEKITKTNVSSSFRDTLIITRTLS